MESLIVANSCSCGGVYDGYGESEGTENGERWVGVVRVRRERRGVFDGKFNCGGELQLWRSIQWLLRK